ncbi:N-acetylmuramoyl-L-alanine amidase [Weissella viridescens]|uniref:N-acetylmuramoyl-L-alanine amidase n=1 Tax=Weissella viridescens TaxID=1629 RepID=A0A380P799_WEIVI|nr:N-acetylmuramoyl-L-alanine amidase [Weissella viridescens]
MPNKGVAFGDYLVLRDNKVPAILMENGYINSDRDFNHFKTARFQQKLQMHYHMDLNGTWKNIKISVVRPASS